MMRADAILAGLLIAATAAPAVSQTTSPHARTESFAKLPYWPGYWVSERQAGTTIGGLAPATIKARKNGTPLRGFMSLAGFAAPWNAEGQKRLAAERAAAGGRKAMGWGYPMMMDAAAPIQFLITPEETLIINPYADVRHIYTDGRSHPKPDDVWPTVWGDSVGHWEGDTLVVDTFQVKNPNLYFHGAPPLSEQAHYAERIHMDGERIVDEFTIEDPVTLTGPWKTTVTYVRDPGFDRMVQIDFDNDRTGFDGTVNTIEPPKDEK